MKWSWLKTPALLGLSFVLLWWTGLIAPGPKLSGPSADSLRAEAFRDSLDRAVQASAHRDSVHAREVDSLNRVADHRARAAVDTLRVLTTDTVPSGTPADTTTYWRNRAWRGEAAFARYLGADTLYHRDLRQQFADQQGETGRLRSLLGDVQDTLANYADAFGKKDRALARARGGIHLGVVAQAAYAGGCWTSLGGVELERRGKVLFLQTETRAAGGIGAGGCGAIPRTQDQVHYGPAATLTVKVGA